MAFFHIWLAIALFFQTSNEKEWLSRLQALSMLGDASFSLEVAQEALMAFPNSQELYLQTIRLYAQAGDEKGMMQRFREYQVQFPNEAYPRDLLENMAWGIIQNGFQSPTALTRAMACIAAALGNDARGIALLVKGIHDPNRLVRLLAVEFASNYRDACLQEEVVQCLYTEQDYAVKQALLEAIGKMKIYQAQAVLLKIVGDEQATAEQQEAAVTSLVSLNKLAHPSTIRHLIQHSRAGLRVLGAQLILHNEKLEDAELLIPLLSDTHSEVRKSALLTLGILRIRELNGQNISAFVTPLSQDPSPEVQMLAAWVNMLNAPKEGQALLKPWLSSKNKAERLFATAILSHAGKYGFPLTLRFFQETDDPYVKINLARTLIRQGVQVQLGTDALFCALNQNHEKWMKKEWGPFEVIAPGEVRHRADIPNFPEAVNQITRLEIFNELALLHHSGAQEGIMQFLKERPWGISGAASSLLLTEGDEEALVLIRTLLQDPSEKIRLQAALILGLWGHDPEALDTLQQAYQKAQRAQKEQILEALGQIGEISSIPFLVNVFEDSFQTLRILAAAALLQTLYH